VASKEPFAVGGFKHLVAGNGSATSRKRQSHKANTKKFPFYVTGSLRRVRNFDGRG